GEESIRFATRLAERCFHHLEGGARRLVTHLRFHFHAASDHQHCVLHSPAAWLARGFLSPQRTAMDAEGPQRWAWDRPCRGRYDNPYDVTGGMGGPTPSFANPLRPWRSLR